MKVLSVARKTLTELAREPLLIGLFFACSLAAGTKFSEHLAVRWDIAVILLFFF